MSRKCHVCKCWLIEKWNQLSVTPSSSSVRLFSSGKAIRASVIFSAVGREDPAGTVRRKSLVEDSLSFYSPEMIKKNPFRYFKTSPEVIRLAVMMYVRFPLSLRNVEDLLDERGIDISYETIRYWWNRFGPLFASDIRKKRIHPAPNRSNWRWHLDEVFVKINGEIHYLWRAVDHEGEVLEAFVSKRRNRKAALTFLKKIMKRYGQPYVIVTDKLRSYRAAMKQIGNEAFQTTGHWLNNRAENSHQSFRRRERAMAKFRSVKSLQKFTAIHSSVHDHFNQQRHLYNREAFKLNRLTALAEWRQLAV